MGPDQVINPSISASNLRYMSVNGSQGQSFGHSPVPYSYPGTIRVPARIVRTPHNGLWKLNSSWSGTVRAIDRKENTCPPYRMSMR